jgi:hypothetical protein
VIDMAGRADAGAFVARVLRLDPAALVRLRPVRGNATTEIWAMLPFRVLVMRILPVRIERDITVAASALLDTLRDDTRPAPPARDAAWRWPLPPGLGRAVEVVPAVEVTRVAQAASRTLREASTQGIGGRAVGERVVRDTLLDHVPIIVTGSDGERVEVPQRLVQAVVRMGFLGQEAARSVTFGDDSVTVRRSSSWIGLDASYGSAWYRPISPMTLS